MRKAFSILTLCVLSVLALFSCSKKTDSSVHYPVYEAQRFTFGTFEQDGIAENGMEDIVWRLLCRSRDKALLVSEYALDTVTLSDRFETVDYYSGALGDWLSLFYDSSFTEDEKGCILEENKNGKIFIPDSGLFTSENITELSCVPTEYARTQGVYFTSSGKSQEICWWFADSGRRGDTVRCAIDGKTVSSVPVTTAGIGIRPAIWVDYGKLEEHFTITLCLKDNFIFFEGDSPEEALTDIYAVSKVAGAVSIRNVCTISPETFTQTGRQYITAEFNGHTKSIETYVYPKPADIELYTPPSESSFTLGSSIKVDGVSFLVTMDGGEQQMIIDRGYTFQPKKALTEGVCTVWITIAGKTFEHQISVVPPEYTD